MTGSAGSLWDLSWPAWGGAPAPVLRAHFCPDLRRALFAISDHGDRTRYGPTRALYFGHSDSRSPEFRKRGFCANGVKVTQGVFVSGWDGFDYLDNPDFMDLMREVSRAGIEVCPHNTSEHMDLAAADVRRNIELYRANFGLTTWIDHFRLPSNLTQQGMDPTSEYYILDQFRDAGGLVAWSFRDTFSNSPGPTLNQLVPPRNVEYLRALAQELLHRRDAVALRRARGYLTHLLSGLIGIEGLGALLVLRKPWRHVGWRRKIRAMATLAASFARRLGGLPAPGRSRRPFPVRYDPQARLFWFDSVRVLFVSRMFQPEGIDDLVRDRGIHIAHSYLGLTSPKYPDRAFEADGEHFRVTPQFDEFLASVAARVRDGGLWNPTLREMAAYFDGLRRVEVRRDGSRIELRNTSTAALTGLTLCSAGPLRPPSGVVHRAARVGTEHWTCLDLPGGTSLAFHVGSRSAS